MAKRPLSDKQKAALARGRVKRNSSVKKTSTTVTDSKVQTAHAKIRELIASGRVRSTRPKRGNVARSFHPNR